MGGRDHDLDQMRPTICDNNPGVNNNHTGQRARIKYCYVIQLDRKTP